MAISQKSADFFLRSRIADAENGDVDALYDLGVTYSTGRGGIAVDLIEAHKWFNLARLSGDTRSQACRAEISIEMTAREIAEAQRQAARVAGPSGHQGTRLIARRRREGPPRAAGPDTLRRASLGFRLRSNATG